MASYIANNQSRDTVTLMLSKAEADALSTLACKGFDAGVVKMNNQTTAAVNRAIDALIASTNTSARRAGYSDV